ncbi:MAG TPA: response regulator [Dongiaceae bacterium]|nr:response regulator [Dongiaceae bacterium]
MAGSASILIIDDDAAVSRTLSLILTRAGHQVTTVTRGRKGLELLSQGGFDLVLTDIIMPELDGIEAIRRIRTDHPGLRIIAMSGGGQIDKADFLHMAEALGADRVLEKPVRSERLLELVGSVMANPPRQLPARGS